MNENTIKKLKIVQYWFMDKIDGRIGVYKNMANNETVSAKEMKNGDYVLFDVPMPTYGSLCKIENNKGDEVCFERGFYEYTKQNHHHVGWRFCLKDCLVDGITIPGVDSIINGESDAFIAELLKTDAIRKMDLPNLFIPKLTL